MKNENCQHFGARLPMRLINRIREDADKNHRSATQQVRWILDAHFDKKNG